MNSPRVVRRPDIPEWLENLAMIPNASFPMEELQALWDRGDEVEQLLLQYVRWLADEAEMGWLELEDDSCLHFIAFFLLADRGCHELFQPLVDIGMDEDYADFVMGDAVTEDLPLWLAAVGSPEALRRVVENEDANPWLAVAALSALGTMAWEGRIPRLEQHDYLKELAQRRERTDHPLWMEWLSQVGLFAWDDLLDMVGELEKAGMFDGTEGVATTQRLIGEPDRDSWAADSFSRYTPGGSSGLEHFSKLPCFQPGYVGEDEDSGGSGESNGAPEPVVPEFIPFGNIPREEPKIGRNDPCPCGSGKRWKNCCGK